MIDKDYFADEMIIRDTIIRAGRNDRDLHRRVVGPFGNMRERVLSGQGLTSKQAKWVNDIRERLGLKRHRFA